MGMSKLRKMNVAFVDSGVKINGAYYHEVLLCEISGEFFIFQQDSALLLHTDHVKQSAFWNGRLSYHQTWDPSTVQMTIWGEIK